MRERKEAEKVRAIGLMAAALDYDHPERANDRAKRAVEGILAAVAAESDPISDDRAPTERPKGRGWIAYDDVTPLRDDRVRRVGCAPVGHVVAFIGTEVAVDFGHAGGAAHFVPRDKLEVWTGCPVAECVVLHDGPDHDATTTMHIDAKGNGWTGKRDSTYRCAPRNTAASIHGPNGWYDVPVCTGDSSRIIGEQLLVALEAADMNGGRGYDGRSRPSTARVATELGLAATATIHEVIDAIRRLQQYVRKYAVVPPPNHDPRMVAKGFEAGVEASLDWLRDHARNRPEPTSQRLRDAAATMREDLLDACRAPTPILAREEAAPVETR